MNIVFSHKRKIIINNEGDLLHVNSTCKKVSRDEDTARTRAELPHNSLTIVLLDVPMLQINNVFKGLIS